jgi:hypothetical protein
VIIFAKDNEKERVKCKTLFIMGNSRGIEVNRHADDGFDLHGAHIPPSHQPLTDVADMARP